MDVSEIEGLGDLIAPLLGTTGQYLGAEIKRLTVAGENYGSLMLAVDIKVKKNGNNETIHAVAKLLPPNIFLQKMFNCPITFFNEVAFYKSIVPIYDHFQMEQGAKKLFQGYPGFYGGRMSMDLSKTEVDDGAVLLMENLKITGYETLNRKIGFDFDTAALILTELAHLHAVSMAFSLLKPDQFEKDLSPFFKEFKMAADMGDPEEMKAMMIDKTLSIIQDDDVCAANLPAIREVLDWNCANFMKHPKNSKVNRDGLFLGLVHSDLWVNNVMVKYVDGKPVRVKLVDFQIFEYSLLARDVVFFLFSSVQIPVLQKHSDSLISLYYDRLMEHLKELKCNTEKFTFEAFQKELKEAIKLSEFFHVLMMLTPIFAEKEDIKELTELSLDDFKEDRTITKAHKDKACFVTREFIRRGWV